MKPKTLLTPFVLLILGTAAAQSDLPFGVGEQLLYDLSFNIIKAGSATLRVSSLDTIDNFPSYHIVFFARSNALVDRLYKVRDKIETWIDAEEFFTRKFRKNIREWKYRQKFSASVNYVDSVLTSGDKTFQIDHEIRDPYSLFYYLRTIPLKVGDLLSFTTFDNNQFVDFQVIVHRKETVKVPAGKFSCLVIEPFREGRALLKSKGDMKIWLSNDARRLPVKIVSKASFGSMTMKLKGVTSP